MKIAVFLKSNEINEFEFEERHAHQLTQQLPESTVVVCEDESIFLNELKDSEIALVWGFKQDWFAAAQKLRLISTPAAGKDYFNVILPKGTELWYGAFHGQIMGETAVGMMLGMAHRLIPCAQEMTQNQAKWPRDSFTGHARSLRGAHVVILGFGSIGQAVGRMIKPFGVRVTGVRRSRLDERPEWFTEGDQICAVSELDEVLKTAEHVMCVLPSGAETTHLLDARRLSLLSKTAYVYNIGRGNAIDETTLVEALKCNQIAGACLDVFEREPLAIDSALRSLPNAYLYPHVSAVSPEYIKLYVEELTARIHTYPNFWAK